MEDGYRLIDYGINLNDVIQLMTRAAMPKPQSKEAKKPAHSTKNEEDKENKQKKTESIAVECTCEYYEVCYVKYDLLIRLLEN